MNDLIFGSLSTDELRRIRVLEQHRGVKHHGRRYPRDPLPMQAVQLELTAGPETSGEQAWVYWTTDGSEPGGSQGHASHGFAAPMQTDGATWDTELWGYLRKFNVDLPGQPDGTIVRYRLSLQDRTRGEIYADQGAVSAFYAANDPTPAWATGAVVYHIFVDRFNPGSGHDWKSPTHPSGFYGGRIRGIIEKLDYLQDAGFNTLWLSPIFPSPSHHGYDATDLYNIEPRLGSTADLKELLEACHARGMRVLLDFVPNHWSDKHAAFQSALKDANSPFHDWFTFTHWPDEYNTFFGVKNLPQVNLKNPAARDHMIGAALHWLSLGVDGFRLDYAIGPAQEFWADFRQQTRTANPQCWTFGEVIDPPTDQLAFEGLLDGCLDFNLLEALRQTMAFKTWDVPHFASFLERHEAFFPASFSRPSFLDNHDMNRFLWIVGGNMHKLKLAALCQFSLAGAPILYYGTEVGLSQERDIRQGDLGVFEESRLPMLWGTQQNAELLAFYRDLITLRKTCPDLSGYERATLYADDQLLVYRKKSALVVLNIGPAEKVYALPDSNLKISLSTAETCISEGSKIRLSGWSGAILM